MMISQTTTAIPIDQTPSFSEVQTQRPITFIESGMKEIYTDDAITTGLKTQDLAMIKYIYKKFFHQISAWITSNSGTRMDAEDVFQDALVVLYKKLSRDTLAFTGSFKACLFSVCRHLWLKKLNTKGLCISCDDMDHIMKDDDQSQLEQITRESEKFNLIARHFQQMSIKDQKLLRLFMKKVPLAEITSILGYKSYDYTKARKYLCKEKLRKAILNDPEYRALLLCTM
jgi:RNA polymerase sigma factor (sigma-70 family)